MYYKWGEMKASLRIMKYFKSASILFALIVALSFSFSQVRAYAEPRPNPVHPRLHIEPVNTYIVTKTADTDAVGTLRWAINQANASAGFDLIRFEIEGSGVKTITVQANGWLPDITDDAGVMIDGTLSNDRIEVNAAQQNNYHYILALYSTNNVIKGLVLNNTPGGAPAIGIRKGYNTILGNFLGTNPAGTEAKGAWEGIRIEEGSNYNVIGGTNGVTPGGSCTGDCNLLSGNRAHGMVIDHADYNTVIGNFMGVDVTGTKALPNAQDGIIVVNGSNNTIGGDTPQERNIISGNKVVNLEVGQTNRTTRDNVFSGNYIGPTSGGNASANGAGAGVVLSGNSSSIFENNVVSGNGGMGFLIMNGSTGNQLRNNYVGVGANGTTRLPNNIIGMIIQTNNNQIEGNIVANHASDGVRVKSGTGNAIRRNSIYSNTKLGINIAVDGYTPNDTGDTDSGPNNLQNFPVLSAANASGGNIGIQGSLNSRPNARYTIEFFHNPVCDNTYQHQEAQGKTYLGEVTVTTNSSGNASFNSTFNFALGNGIVTSTATDASGNTSEFSLCKTISNTEPVPAKPQLTSPTNGSTVTSNPPRLNWAASAGAHHYVIYIRQDSKTGTIVHKNSNVQAPPYTPSAALATGHTYYWKVKACNSLNQCSGSVWYSFIVP